MAWHRGALSGVWLCLSLVLAVALLTGCVHFVPREERQSNHAAEEQTTEPLVTSGDEETTVTTVDPDFPNDPDDGHTKRY